jgi:hypothetical protein
MSHRWNGDGSSIYRKSTDFLVGEPFSSRGKPERREEVMGPLCADLSQVTLVTAKPTASTPSMALQVGSHCPGESTTKWV